MSKKAIIIIICAVAVFIAAILFFFVFSPKPPAPEPPEPPTPDSASLPQPPPTRPPMTKGTTAEQKKDSESKTEKLFDEKKAKKLDLFKEFGDFPVHFITHEGGPIEEGSRYLHATIEISSDGTVTGEFFSNMESTDAKVVEHHSKWTAKIRKNKVYRTDEGRYFLFFDDVKYEKKPDTSKEKDGKTLRYAYGYGLDPAIDNCLEVFPPDTPFEKLQPTDSDTDIRDFLRLMFKDVENDTTDFYILRGSDNSNYVSITEEEANQEPPEMPEQGEEPEKPERPQ